MGYIIILAVAVVMAGYFGFRYFSLALALDKICRDMEELSQDLTQNQILRLPAPDPHLKKLLKVMNSVLEAVRTERRHYELREREFRKQIENISHDLRTPLTVILGYLKLFRKSCTERMEDDRELADTLETVEKKAEAMKELVSQFYDYSRLNAGDYELELTDVDISRTLRESLAGNCEILIGAGLRAEAEIPEHPVRIMGNEAAYERIFQNLFQNAARYAASEFRVKLEEDGEKIFIHFINDTETLSEQDLPHLFERFYMEDASRSCGGTGLGLTVARALAEEMGAQLSVELRKRTDAQDERAFICFKLSFGRMREGAE